MAKSGEPMRSGFFDFLLWLRKQTGAPNSNESSEANTPAESKIDKSLRETYGLIPLEAHVCRNKCGCVSLYLQAPHDHIRVLAPMPSSDMHLPAYLWLN